MHRPILVAASTNSLYDKLDIYVQYEFIGSPHPDFTLKVYSKFDQPILDSRGNSNEINMDGQQPSGFTESCYTGMDNWDCSKPANYCRVQTDNNGGGGGDTQNETRDVSKIEVKSLADVFTKSKDLGEFF